MSQNGPLDEERRRLQREVELLEQSLGNTDLHTLSSLSGALGGSDDSDSDSSEDQDLIQDQPRPGPQPATGPEPDINQGPEPEGRSLLEQRERLHRQIQELEKTLGPNTDNHTDEEDEDEEDSDSSSSDESEMELPRSVESCLQMNLVYQQVIEETLEQLENLLQQNNRQQKELLVQLSGPGSDWDQSKSKSSDHINTNLYLGSFLKPYFKDRLSGLGPPSNPESKEKAKAIGTTDNRNLRIRRWEGWQKSLLIHAVSKDRLRKLTQPKLSKIDYLTRKLKLISASDSTSEPGSNSTLDSASASVQIQEQIRALEQEIQTFREKKEEELIGDRYADVDWDRISNIDFEGSREASDLQCFWQNFLHPSLNKDKWSQKEIERLREISLNNQERNWTTISEELQTGRTAFTCLQTFQRFASQSLRKRKWTEEEDTQLKRLVEKMRIGNFIPWQQICYFMEDRLPAQLLYRWCQVLDPAIKKGPWSPDEDQLLLAAVEKHGAKYWWKIRLEVPGRTDTSCRDRYLECLQPGIKKGPFDSKEILTLRRLVQKHGVGRWAKIAAEMENRTDNQILKAYQRLMKTGKRGRNQTVKTTQADLQVNKTQMVINTKRTTQKLTRSSGKRKPSLRTEEVWLSSSEEDQEVMTLMNQELAMADLEEKKPVVREQQKNRRPVEVKEREGVKCALPASEQKTTIEEEAQRNLDQNTDQRQEEPEEQHQETLQTPVSVSVSVPTPAPAPVPVTASLPVPAPVSVSVSWMRLDLGDWLPEDTPRNSFNFTPVSLCVSEGEQRGQRCTVVDSGGHSVVETLCPVELPREQLHNNVSTMIRAEVLLSMFPLPCLHRQRQTNKYLTRKLQRALMPWIGHMVFKRDSSATTKLQNNNVHNSETTEPQQTEPISGAEPEESSHTTAPSPLPNPPTPQAEQISFTRLFRFFLRLLRVDAEGCRREINKQQRKADTSTSDHSNLQGSVLQGLKRIKQEPVSPERVTTSSTSSSSSLPLLFSPPQNFTPFAPQSQHCRLLPTPSPQSVKLPLPRLHTKHPVSIVAPPLIQLTKAPPLSTKTMAQMQTKVPVSMADVASQNQNVHQVCIASQTLSQSQNGRPAPVLSPSPQPLLNPQKVHKISPTSLVEPKKTLAPDFHPQLSIATKQNVHPVPLPSSFNEKHGCPVLSSSLHLPIPSPPLKQNVRLFRDAAEGRKLHVIKVYAKRDTLDMKEKKKKDQAISETDQRAQSSDSDALLDHDYILGGLTNDGAASVQTVSSTNQGTASVQPVASNNQTSPSIQLMTPTNQEARFVKTMALTNQGAVSVQTVTSTNQGSASFQTVLSTNQQAAAVQLMASTNQKSVFVRPVASTNKGSVSVQPVTSTNQLAAHMQPLALTNQATVSVQTVASTNQEAASVQHVASTNLEAASVQPVTPTNQGARFGPVLRPLIPQSPISVSSSTLSSVSCSDSQNVSSPTNQRALCNDCTEPSAPLMASTKVPPKKRVRAEEESSTEEISIDPIYGEKKRNRESTENVQVLQKKANTEEVCAVKGAMEETRIDEAGQDSKRKRKPTMKALALQDQKKMEGRRTKKKQAAKPRKKTKPLNLTSSPPTSIVGSIPSNTTSVHPNQTLPPLKTALPYPFVPIVFAKNSSAFPCPNPISLFPSPSILSSGASSLSSPRQSLSHPLVKVQLPSAVSNVSPHPDQVSLLPSAKMLSSNACMTPFLFSQEPPKGPLPVPIDVSVMSNQTLFFSPSKIISSASSLQPFPVRLGHAQARLTPTQTPGSLLYQASPHSNLCTPPFAFVPPSHTALFKSPQTRSVLAPPPFDSELCDWLGVERGRQAEVSCWLSGVGGVSIGAGGVSSGLDGASSGAFNNIGGVSKLPYLPPFICNLKTLSLLLQKREELRREAEKMLTMLSASQRGRTTKSRRITEDCGTVGTKESLKTLTSAENQATNPETSSRTKATADITNINKVTETAMTTEITQTTEDIEVLVTTEITQTPEVIEVIEIREARLDSDLEERELLVINEDVETEHIQTKTEVKSQTKTLHSEISDSETKTLDSSTLETEVTLQVQRETTEQKIKDNITKMETVVVNPEKEELDHTETSSKTQTDLERTISAEVTAETQTDAEQPTKQRSEKKRANQRRGQRRANQRQKRQPANLKPGQQQANQRPGNKPANQKPGDKPANQRPEPAPEPFNQEPAKKDEAELTEAVRGIVRARYCTDPTHQLLLARFKSIFTMPALLASLQPMGEQEMESSDDSTEEEVETE